MMQWTFHSFTLFFMPQFISVLVFSVILIIQIDMLLFLLEMLPHISLIIVCLCARDLRFIPYEVFLITPEITGS